MLGADQWNAEHSAIWQERIELDGTSRAITLRHPSYPFTADYNRTSGTGEQLRAIAAAYLRKVRHLFGLPADLLDDNGQFQRSLISLTWLPIQIRPTPEPDSSFWIHRYGRLQAGPDASLPNPIDSTAIIFAVPWSEVLKQQQVLGSRLAIRIVMLVPGTGASPQLRITGATCSAELPRILDRQLEERLQRFIEWTFTEEGRRELISRVGVLTNLLASGLWIDGVGIGKKLDRRFFEVYLTYERQSEPHEKPAYAITVRVPLDELEPFEAFRALEVEKFPLVSNCTTVTRNLFYKNPPSRARPNREGTAFAADLRPTKLIELRPESDPTKIPLKDRLVEVRQSRLARGDDKASEEVRPIRGVRTTAFGALSAYQHARELFDAMLSYGLDPKSYFRAARLPLRVRYWAGIRPGYGKDGKVVNASVDYDPPRRQHRGQPEDTHRRSKPLQVMFALADLKRSASRREPLSLACDPRWSWHEYAHVLIAASTGALELPFAHSTGDAFAAIVGDPQRSVNDPLRMATFPWVYLNRSHDRCVHHGWSWCGTHHRQSRFPPDSAFRRKGYQSEQILSTSLFRLYRALGGDTAADQRVRQAAADYTVYLIMRAIAWLGPVAYAPAETPDQFVSALVDADIATAPTPPPYTSPLTGRVGGCAHKVVRWAFEAQGLYASDPLAVTNQPGNPTEVDVFVDDRRTFYDATHRPGAYTPVPLDWGSTSTPSFWHATDDAISVDSGGGVFVNVRNRGSKPATDVVVDVWHADRASAPSPAPDWERSRWTHLGSSARQTVPPGGDSVRFGPLSGLPSGRPLLILAAATCAADPANTDIDTHLPCTIAPTPVVDLVAGDNNLGLRAHW